MKFSNSLKIFFLADDLFKADVDRIGMQNGRLSNTALASFLFNQLRASYPESMWMVNIYNPVAGWDKHAVYGHYRKTYYHKFRYYNHNLVVVRYPGQRTDRPDLRLTGSLASIVGTENGDNARDAVESIKRKFGSQSWYCIHAVRSGSGFYSDYNIPAGVNYLRSQFSSLDVTVIAPDVISYDTSQPHSMHGALHH